MLRPTSWPCPASPPGVGSEFALIGDTGADRRLLITPALFDESNRLRHFIVAVMRALEAIGIGTFLPDLAGCNESLQPVSGQTITGWRTQVQAACGHFDATHMLTIRAGAMLDPGTVPIIRYAPVATSSALRSLLRARVIAEREAGREVTRDDLLEQGVASGLTLAGYELSSAMLAEMQQLTLPDHAGFEITQADIGGAGLWLRAEPGHDPAQAANLARIVAEQIA